MQCVSVQMQFFILLSLYWEILSEIGFIEGMRTTWANNSVQPILSDKNIQEQNYDSFTEVESSKTHFEVLGLEGQVLGLQVSCPRKLVCPRLEDSSIFWTVKILWSAWKKILKTFLFWRAFALVSLVLGPSIPVLGLERFCPRKGCSWRWPRIFLWPWPWPRALCFRLHLCSFVKFRVLNPKLNSVFADQVSVF